MANKKDNTNEDTAMTVSGAEDLQAMAARPVNAVGGGADFASLPQTREQLAIVSELLDLDRAIESGFDKTTSPGDLAEAGTVFNIVDAWKTTMNEDGEVKPKVCFLIEEQETGISHTVMQSCDSAGIREKYAERFSTWKALSGGQLAAPLVGFRFVQGQKIGKAGNYPYILEKIKTRPASLTN